MEHMFVVSPRADHGPMRLVAKLGRVTRTSRFLERFGFGWTIMLLATARVTGNAPIGKPVDVAVECPSPPITVAAARRQPLVLVSAREASTSVSTSANSWRRSAI